MKRGWKRAFKWLGIVLVGLVLVVAGVWYSAFGNSRQIVDGQALAQGVTTVKDGFVSVFLLDAGPGKVALVDAGNDKEGKAILAALQKRGLQPSAVSAIFLTHGHGDHTAACALFPNAEIYALQAEQPMLAGSVKVTHPLTDGEKVDVGDLRVETFAAPGHTPGSAVFLARGVLFFGDSAGASSGGEVKKGVWLFTKDTSQNLASLKGIATRLGPRAAEIKELAFAHTGPLVGLEPLTAFASAN
jgi:glyoxylase-like metal-dependent hydrolase (beta-lactamase superfamily II)